MMVSLAGCATADYVTGEKTFNRFSLEEDVEIGTQQATLILAAAEAQGMVIDPDEATTRAVRTVSARLLPVPWFAPAWPYPQRESPWSHRRARPF